MRGMYPKLIEDEDMCCYNCDNFIRDENEYLGVCLLKEKKVDNEHDSCKKYVKKEEY